MRLALALAFVLLSGCAAEPAADVQGDDPAPAQEDPEDVEVFRSDTPVSWMAAAAAPGSQGQKAMAQDRATVAVTEETVRVNFTVRWTCSSPPAAPCGLQAFVCLSKSAAAPQQARTPCTLAASGASPLQVEARGIAPGDVQLVLEADGVTAGIDGVIHAESRRRVAEPSEESA